MTRLEQKVIVRCKRCEWRIFDKVTMTTGNIEIKCPKCGYVNEIDLHCAEVISNSEHLEQTRNEQTTE